MCLSQFFKYSIKRNENDDFGFDGNAALKIAHDIFDPIDPNLVNNFLDSDPTRTLDIANKLLLYANSFPDQDNNAADIVKIRNYITADETKDIWLEQLDAWALTQLQTGNTNTNDVAGSGADTNTNTNQGTNEGSGSDTNTNTNQGYSEGSGDGASSNADSYETSVALNNLSESNALNSNEVISNAANSSPLYQEALFYLEGVVDINEIGNQFSQDQRNAENFVLMIQRYQQDHFTLIHEDNRQLMRDWILEQSTNGENWIQKIQTWFQEYYDANGTLSILTTNGYVSSQTLRDRFSESYSAIAEELGPNVVVDDNIDFSNPENLKYRSVTNLYFIDVVVEYKLMGQLTEFWQETLAQYQQKLQNGQASEVESRDIPVIQNIIKFNLDGKSRMEELAAGLSSGSGYVLQLSEEDFQIKPTSTRSVVSMCTEYGERFDPRTIAIYYAGTNASPDRIAEINKYIRENPMTWYFDFCQLAGSGGITASGGNGGSGSGGGPDWGDALGTGNPFDGLNSIQQQNGLGGQTLTTRQEDHDRWNPTNPGSTSNSNANPYGTANNVDPGFLEANGVGAEEDRAPIVFQTRNGDVTTTYTIEYNEDGTVTSRAVDERDSLETIRFREANEAPVSLPSGLTARQIDRLFQSETALSDFLKLSPEFQEAYASDENYFNTFVLGRMVAETFKMDLSHGLDVSGDLSFNDFNRVKRIIENPTILAAFDKLDSAAKAELLERIAVAKRIQISSDSVELAAQTENMDVFYSSKNGIEESNYWTGVVASYLARQNIGDVPLSERTAPLTVFAPQVPQELSNFVFPLEVMGSDGKPRHAGTVSVFQVQTSEGVKYGFATNAHTMLQQGELIGYDGKPIELGPNGFVPFVSLPNGQRIEIPTEGGTSIIYGRNNAGAPGSDVSYYERLISGDITLGLAGSDSSDMQNFISRVVPESARGQIPLLGSAGSVTEGASVVQVGVPGYVNMNSSQKNDYILVGTASTVTANKASIDGTIEYTHELKSNNIAHSGGSSGGPVYQITTVVDPSTGERRQVYTLVAINAYVHTTTGANVQTSGGAQIIADPNSSLGFVLPSTLTTASQNGNSGSNNNGGSGG